MLYNTYKTRSNILIIILVKRWIIYASLVKIHPECTVQEEVVPCVEKVSCGEQITEFYALTFTNLRLKLWSIPLEINFHARSEKYLFAYGGIA